MKNPIQVIREEHNLSRTEFSVVCGVVSESVRQIERGTIRNIGPSFREGLERLGYDPEKVYQDLQEWLEQYKEEILSKTLA